MLCHVTENPAQQEIVLLQKAMAQFLDDSVLRHGSHRLAFCQVIILYVPLNFRERNNHTLMLIGKGRPMFSDRCLFYS